jgi:hypothetical protein
MALIIFTLSPIVTSQSMIEFLISTFLPILHFEPMHDYTMLQLASISVLAPITLSLDTEDEIEMLDVFSIYVFTILNWYLEF